jgi:3-methylcrotonyl-CoA carboxylase alpha subunit
MNTGLQVEHPVTEMITGLDLVEWQLRVAAGEALPLTQRDLRRRGHSFEARVYAEDPQRDFLPAIGRVTHLQAPAEDAHVRVDTGVRNGDDISMYYDPMIAKLIVWDEDRQAALRRLRGALAEYQIAGPTTNIGFLAAIAAHPAFAACEIDTGFIERHRDELIASHRVTPDVVLALAAIAVLRRDAASAHSSVRAHADPHSPWFEVDGWQPNADGHYEVELKAASSSRRAHVHFRRESYDVVIDGRVLKVSQVAHDGNMVFASVDGARHRATANFNGCKLTLFANGDTWHFELDDPRNRAEAQNMSSGRIVAPMPGSVVAVLVKQGQRVERNQPLVVIEAMKMEHTLRAPGAGRVVKLSVAQGGQVNDGAELAILEPDSE